jgi:Thoeris protein ThsB, TIR-like domain
MGGGGGSYSGGPGDLDALLKRAKAEAERAKKAKKNVFLSFVMEDLDEVNLLRGQAKNEQSDLEFNDWSVREPYDSKRADYIRQRISERIAQSSMTVVYVSAATAESKWVKWEIEESGRQGKSVLAVHSGDRPPAHLPQAIVDAKIKVVPWSRLAAELDRM